MRKSYKLLWICCVIFAAAIGFFASALIFSNRPALPPFSKNDEVPVFADETSFPNPEMNLHEKKSNKPNFNFKHHMDSALGLSTEQIAKMDSNGKACDSLRREMKKNIHSAEQHLHEVLGAEQIDEAELQSVRAELLLLNERRLDQRIADVKFFKSVLSAEQETKFKELQNSKTKKKMKQHSMLQIGSDKDQSNPRREKNHKKYFHNIQ